MDVNSSGIQARLGAEGAASASLERLAQSASKMPPAQAAKKFEALFATLLVKEMRKALPDGFFGGEAEGDIYAGWFDEHIGETIARNGGLHLAETVQAWLEHKSAGQTVRENDAALSEAGKMPANRRGKGETPAVRSKVGES